MPRRSVRASGTSATRLIRAAHSPRCGKPIVYINTTGAADNGKNIIPFDGESLVYDAAGRLIAIGRQFAEELLVVDIGRPGGGPAGARAAADRSRSRDVRRAGDGAPRLHAQDRVHARGRCRLRRHRLGARAGDCRRRARRRTASSAYNMPSQLQHRDDAIDRGAARARAAASATASFRSRRSTSDVRGVFEAHAHPIAQSLTRENLHARIRGLLMMAESNDTGALLISCGNETEIALGYATLYGDMCGGMSLIGDLSKMDVYRLARYVNRAHGAEMIPEDTFHIKPSAELAAEPVRSVRLLGRLAGRRRAGRAAGQPRRARQAVRAARARPRALCSRRSRAARSTTSTRPRRFRRVVYDASARHAPLGLQTPPGPADRRRHRARLRVRSARDDYQ